MKLQANMSDQTFGILLTIVGVILFFWSRKKVTYKAKTKKEFDKLVKTAKKPLYILPIGSAYWRLFLSVIAALCVVFGLFLLGIIKK